MGALANTYTYESFGKLSASTGTVTNPFRYTGREFDPETGIYEYRARYYDQATGRFLNEDPLGFGGGENFYAYVKNDPTNLVDPLGLFAEVICEPVRQHHLGFWGARHCRLRVSCSHTMPDKTYELNGRTSNQPLTVASYDPSRPGYRIPLHTPNTKCNNCDCEQCLVTAFNFFYDNPSELPHYDPLHQNSNSFVSSLVFRCGGQVDFPNFRFTLNPYYWVNIYGWGIQ
jgi:RHS repeat-associated protein